MKMVSDVIFRSADAYKCHPQAALASEGILECFAERLGSAYPGEAVQDPYVASPLRMTLEMSF